MRPTRLLRIPVAPVFVAGVGSLALSAELWTRTVTTADGLACGSVYELNRGYWSPPGAGEDLTGECLEAVSWPLFLAQALLLAGIVALALATVVITWRTWRRLLGEPRPAGSALLAHVGVALVWCTLAAAVATALALYLDSGPICPWIRAGEYDEYVRLRDELAKQGTSLAQCMAAGGGLYPEDYPVLAALGAIVAAVVYPVTYLLVRHRARSRARPRQATEVTSSR